MTRRAKPQSTTPITSITHRDTRPNIPTEELRDFVADDEKAPRTVRYLRTPSAYGEQRDSSLDPQLVWRGKDEQDNAGLEVPTVPIYIQEKIHPQALIEDVRATARGDALQPELFADFNGMSFEDLIDFYHHSQHWSNRLILGDSLLVMTSLAEKEGLKGQVQMIYIDPPYGIRFGSNWQVSTRKRDVHDGRPSDLTRQPEQIKAFRDTWELGIHSYLSYLRDRLKVSQELLTESGSIFIQIGDDNVHLVRCLLDEVFGSENFCALISVRKSGGTTAELLASPVDYLLWYAKSKPNVKYRPLYLEKSGGNEGAGVYSRIMSSDGLEIRKMTSDELEHPDRIPTGWRIFRLDVLTSQGFRVNTTAPFKFRNVTYHPGTTSNWKATLEGMKRLALAGRVANSGTSLAYVRFVEDFPVYSIDSVWQDTGTGSFTDPKVYVVQTGTKMIARCLLMTTDPGDLVLDPTCGSGTTAYVAEQWGRRWITCDTSRVALALARTRLMTARFPYYLLADSSEGLKKAAELNGHFPADVRTDGDIKRGFVYRRVPHVTLRAIANNEEIEPIDTRWRDELNALRTDLNMLLGCTWEEWQVPTTADASWPARARQIHVEWQRARQARQKEIDASIARHGEAELLYDQPYEDPKRLRVSGPFTVESLSPHRVLSPDEERPVSEASGQQSVSDQFEPTIIDNLRRAGVQNTRKDERLKFDRLEPYPGVWLQAAGEYTDASGATRRVAVSIGPELGTVGPEQVKEAAKEALHGVGFDLVVVCGFAFDALAGETAQEISPQATPSRPGFVAEVTRQYGKLPVMLARINPDLLMGGDLLKKTGAGNLFMVFGEPDIVVTRQQDGKIVVTIQGVDIYDPTTGEIRNSSADDIACWFIDTNYSSESFFVRHAYFTGADAPYDNLKRALRAEIDEAVWATLYTTTSRPFDPPTTGKIAIKVINHYGDEVLKVYDLKHRLSEG